MEGNRKEVYIAPLGVILTYAAIGAVFLALMLWFMWDRGGSLTNVQSGERWRVVTLAALFGFGLGWILYPRYRRPSLRD